MVLFIFFFCVERLDHEVRVRAEGLVGKCWMWGFVIYWVKGDRGVRKVCMR